MNIMVSRQWVLALSILLSAEASGCAAMAARMEANRAAQAATNAPLLQATQSEDGYEPLHNVGAISVFNELVRRDTNQRTGKFKFCETAQRPFLEAGESDKMRATYLPDQRREIEGLINAGTLPADRYYVSARAGTYVSVPLVERAELARNVDAGDVCFWSEGTVQRLSVKRDGNAYTAYHVAASKWDGVLRPHEPVAPAPTVAPPPAAEPSAPGTPASPSGTAP